MLIAAVFIFPEATLSFPSFSMHTVFSPSLCFSRLREWWPEKVEDLVRTLICSCKTYETLVSCASYKHPYRSHFKVTSLVQWAHSHAPSPHNTEIRGTASLYINFMKFLLLWGEGGGLFHPWCHRNPHCFESYLKQNRCYTLPLLYK